MPRKMHWRQIFELVAKKFEVPADQLGSRQWKDLSGRLQRQGDDLEASLQPDRESSRWKCQLE